jgi:hypothetical protein
MGRHESRGGKDGSLPARSASEESRVKKYRCARLKPGVASVGSCDFEHWSRFAYDYVVDSTMTSREACGEGGMMIVCTVCVCTDAATERQFQGDLYTTGYRLRWY